MSDYYSNRTHISQSELKAMHKNPHEWHEIRCGRLPPKKPTDDMKLGNILHCRLLEPHLFTERYATMPAFNLDPENLTKKGKRSTSTNTDYYEAKVAEWIDKNKGREFVDEETIAQVDFMIQAIYRHDQTFDLLSACNVHDNEMEIFAEYRGVKIRGKLDAINHNKTRIIDLKKTQSAEPEQFGKSVIDYGYDVQLAMYLTLVERSMGVTLSPEDYYFILVEDTAPYRVGVQHGTEEMLSLGQAKLIDYLEEYKHRTETNDWLKSWQTGIVPVQLPQWAFSKREKVYE